MTCPVCNSDTAVVNISPSGVDGENVSCTFCGSYLISSSLKEILNNRLTNEDASKLLSHHIRTAHENGQRLFLNTSQFEVITQNQLPKPKEQADKLLLWLAKNSKGPGEYIDLSFIKHGAIVGAKTDAGFTMLVKHLISKGLLNGNIHEFLGAGASSDVFLSFDGWDYYETLQLGSISYRKAFMAMKFGDETLNKLLLQTLKPAVSRAGFELYKLDDKPVAGLIDARMRVEIRAADFVIADLTHDNFGAYWEAGFAEGLGKPVIFICEKSKFERYKTHFDTNHHLAILWEIDKPNEAGEQLTQTIRATLPHLAKLID